MSVRGESAFFRYYTSQKVISDDEFEIWHKTLKTPLPITFRLSPLSNVKKLQSEMRSIEVEALTFLPNLYQLPIRCDRKVLRYASADSEIGRIRRFTRRESGRAITWQEAVSLIPAALLAPESDHVILDMCAAPGSKTTALMEYASRDSSGDGILIANDLDGKRIQTLVHNLPCRKEREPDRDESQRGRVSDASQGFRSNHVRRTGGDGTLRKEPSIWTKWSPRNAIALHPVQLAIASQVCLLKKEESWPIRLVP